MTSSENNGGFAAWQSVRAFFRKDLDCGTSPSGQAGDEDDRSAFGFSSAGNSPGAWTYERVSANRRCWCRVA